MSETLNKASIWLALENSAFRKYWLAALISGTCTAAHNTAVFSVLGKLHDSALVISLMSTLSALPFALFTLPAGALADIVDRKASDFRFVMAHASSTSNRRRFPGWYLS